MPTRNVVLTAHHERVIESLVTSGRYQNVSEVLREGLRLIEDREAHEAAKLKALTDAVCVGFDHLDAGRFTEIGDEALDLYIAGLGRRHGAPLRCEPTDGLSNRRPPQNVDTRGER